MREADIERYLVERVTTLGGETRKVQWTGRDGAPDRLVLLPGCRAFWVELKRPGIEFPSNAHERMQQREHERMRKYGERVEVCGTCDEVDSVLTA